MKTSRRRGGVQLTFTLERSVISEIYGKLEILVNSEFMVNSKLSVNSKYGKLEISNLPNSEFTIFRVYQKFRVCIYSIFVVRNIPEQGVCSTNKIFITYF